MTFVPQDSGSLKGRPVRGTMTALEWARAMLQKESEFYAADENDAMRDLHRCCVLLSKQRKIDGIGRCCVLVREQ